MGSVKNLVTTIMESTGMDIDEILEQRGEKYGEYQCVSTTSQGLKQRLKEGNTVEMQEAWMSESLDLICNKMARIVNGDPYYIDSWKDIAGYAQLVVNELEKNK